MSVLKAAGPAAPATSRWPPVRTRSSPAATVSERTAPSNTANSVASQRNATWNSVPSTAAFRCVALTLNFFGKRVMK